LKNKNGKEKSCEKENNEKAKDCEKESLSFCFFENPREMRGFSFTQKML